MATGKVFACCIAIVALISLHSYGAARPGNYYDDIPSGTLHAISGAVPVSVHRKNLNIPNKILREIRQRVDKTSVSQLDSSLRNDILLDALTPAECVDKYGIRDGALKHIFRGTRDIVAAVIRDVQTIGDDLVQNLPLAPNLVDGLTEAVIYTLCGAEVAFSDAVSDFDDGSDIITIAIVDLLELKGPTPLLDVPRAIVNATELIGKIGKDVIRDIVQGVAAGVRDLVAEVRNGVGDVASDVGEVVNAVESGLQMIGGGLGSGISNILDGVEGGLGGILKAL